MIWSEQTSIESKKSWVFHHHNAPVYNCTQCTMAINNGKNTNSSSRTPSIFPTFSTKQLLAFSQSPMLKIVKETHFKSSVEIKVTVTRKLKSLKNWGVCHLSASMGVGNSSFFLGSSAFLGSLPLECFHGCGKLLIFWGSSAFSLLLPWSLLKIWNEILSQSSAWEIGRMPKVAWC